MGLVAAGATLEGIVLGKTTCVKFGLDAAGDRVVTATAACEGVRF